MSKNETGRKALDIVNNDPRVAKVFHDEDGYWLWLECGNGWTCDPYGAHDGHEDTVKDLLRVYRRMARCECADCTPQPSTAGTVPTLARRPDESIVEFANRTKAAR